MAAYSSVGRAACLVALAIMLQRQPLLAPFAQSNPPHAIVAVSTSGVTDAAKQPAIPKWVSGATCYEVFVRSFYDSDGDGIGDLKGLTQKLDYINDGNPASKRDLGASCIWLMPIAESPSYHGYDVSDYYTVERDYGTDADFKRLVAEAHRRGIRVLVDMVINHMSRQHPLFQAALRDSTSASRDYFRFAPSAGPNNRWGGNNWHKSPLRNEYYYGFFSGGMPDLNYEKPAALAEMKKVATYWLTEMGADGFRLDAVKYLVETGTQAEDTPETHRVLQEYAEHVRRVKPDVYTIGEVFDSTGALLAYYPNQLDGYFAFEIADSILTGVRRGDARGILSPVLRLQRELPSNRYSPFLRNHDQPRTITELGGDGAGAKLAATLLLTLPGFPFVYYGEELGMSGTKPDEQLRTPMAWTKSGPHAGFSTGKPWEPLQSDSLRANVGAMNSDVASLLNTYRTLIHLRASDSALATGDLFPVESSDPAVIAFLRRSELHIALIIENLGARALTGVTLSFPAGAIKPGAYRARTLIGGPNAETFTIGAGQTSTNYQPFKTLAPRTAYVQRLSRIGR